MGLESEWTRVNPRGVDLERAPISKKDDAFVPDIVDQNDRNAIGVNLENRAQKY